jgi:hypothetical protein
MVYGNPVIEEIRARGSASPEEIHAAVTAAIEGTFGGEMTIQAIVFEARTPG